MTTGMNSWNWGAIEDLVGHMDRMVAKTDDFLNALNANVQQLADDSEGDTIVGVGEMHELTSLLQRENQELVNRLRTTLHGSSEDMQDVSMRGYTSVTST